jgi:hypothetical protein
MLGEAKRGAAVLGAGVNSTRRASRITRSIRLESGQSLKLERIKFSLYNRFILFIKLTNASLADSEHLPLKFCTGANLLYTSQEYTGGREIRDRNGAVDRMEALLMLKERLTSWYSFSS